MSVAEPIMIDLNAYRVRVTRLDFSLRPQDQGRLEVKLPTGGSRPLKIGGNVCDLYLRDKSDDVDPRRNGEKITRTGTIMRFASVLAIVTQSERARFKGIVTLEDLVTALRWYADRPLTERAFDLREAVALYHDVKRNTQGEDLRREVSQARWNDNRKGRKAAERAREDAAQAERDMRNARRRAQRAERKTRA